MPSVQELRFHYLIALSKYWVKSNPVLFSGELGIEKDTWRVKVGDGVSSWVDLPYANLEPSSTLEVEELGANLYATAQNKTDIENLTNISLWEVVSLDLANGYIGYKNNKTWKIKRKTGTYPTISRTYARPSNNAGYSTLEKAWENREDLNYA